VATLLQADRVDLLCCGAGFVVVFSFARGGPRLAGTLVDEAALEWLGRGAPEDEIAALASGIS
jgi:hypothetical protein